MLEGARKLADLHLQLASLPEVEKRHFLRRSICFAEVKRHNRELRNLRNYTHKKKKKLSLKSCTSRRIPCFWNSQKAWKTGTTPKIRVQLCHGDYHHHNVLDCSNLSYIQHFENMRIDSAMSDLAKYMRKALEKIVGMQSLESRC